MSLAAFIASLVQCLAAMRAMVLGCSTNRGHWRGQPVPVRVQAGRRRVR